MKNLNKVAIRPKTKSKKRLFLLSLRIKKKKKSKFIKKLSKHFQEVFSPHNTTGFLISNNSSSFIPDEEDISIDLNPDPFSPFVEKYSDLLQKDDQNLEFKEINLDLELPSTAAQSRDFGDKKILLE